jgi:hypothetical protein
MRITKAIAFLACAGTLFAQWVPYSAEKTITMKVVTVDGKVLRQTVTRMKEYRAENGSVARVDLTSGKVQLYVPGAAITGWYELDPRSKTGTVERRNPGQIGAILQDPGRGDRLGPPLRREMKNGCLASVYPVYGGPIKGGSPGPQVGLSWYCDELQTFVGREVDMPSGDVRLIEIRHLESIRRETPPPDLFEISADYKLTERSCADCIRSAMHY